MHQGGSILVLLAQKGNWNAARSYVCKILGEVVLLCCGTSTRRQKNKTKQ